MRFRRANIDRNPERQRKARWCSSSDCSCQQSQGQASPRGTSHFIQLVAAGLNKVGSVGGAAKAAPAAKEAKKESKKEEPKAKVPEPEPENEDFNLDLFGWAYLTLPYLSHIHMSIKELNSFFILLWIPL